MEKRYFRHSLSVAIICRVLAFYNSYLCVNSQKLRCTNTICNFFFFLEEARKKKFKKKHLKKLLGLVMLLKAKLSLILQLISTHFQFKFFIIAIISLILNAARFWIEIKKTHPSKVIYYEHAQHQHHYDHDEHGYWGRSSNETPQELAYRAYIPAEWHRDRINLTEETILWSRETSEKNWTMMQISSQNDRLIVSLFIFIVSRFLVRKSGNICDATSIFIHCIIFI